MSCFPDITIEVGFLGIVFPPIQQFPQSDRRAAELENLDWIGSLRNREPD